MTISELTKLTVLSENACRQIDQWLEKFPADQQKSAVLYALRVVQAENGGWLTTELMTAVADYLAIPMVAVFEVATFYSMYDLKPVGRHKIKICTSISCMLRGSDKIIAHLNDRFNIKMGETTSDGLFTFKAVECLAACGKAPALQIDDQDYFEEITPEKIDLILAELQARGSINDK